MVKKIFSTQNFNKDFDYYPIVLIPDGINDGIYEDINDRFIEKYTSLKKPLLDESYLLREPSKTKLVNKKRIDLEAICSLYFLFPFFFIIIMILFGVYIIFSSEGLPRIGGIGPLFVSLWGFRHMDSIIEEVSIEKIKPAKKLEKEWKHYNAIKLEYREKHNKQNELYKKKLERYKITLVENKEYAIEQYLCKIHSSAIGFNENTENLKRGRLEVKFLEYLLKEFGDQIKVDRFIKIIGNTYQPDFIFKSELTDLCIDIEIDEPYAFSNKEPIHYGSIDEERNLAFLKNNWCVVRFSEKQIAQYPDECVIFLRELIDVISLKKHGFQEYIYFDEKWSYEKALVMADNNYRKNYKMKA